MPRAVAPPGHGGLGGTAAVKAPEPSGERPDESQRVRARFIPWE